MKKCGSFREEHVVPGWNEYVADKHSLARWAGLTIRHGTHVRRAPGWKGPPNDMRPKF